MTVARKIVVAFDDPASRTLARAADLAEALGSELIVTNVAAADPDEAGEEARYGRERLDQAVGFARCCCSPGWSCSSSCRPRGT